MAIPAIVNPVWQAPAGASQMAAAACLVGIVRAGGTAASLRTEQVQPLHGRSGWTAGPAPGALRGEISGAAGA